jgi:hypothetical protein
MRAMAILYIGPHRDPDFLTDYHISPILAPNELLVQFPPLLMQCGEKDPFVDDTVIFAGRVREAKRARKAELDLAIAGKSARFGEGLRMSIAEPEGARLVAMKKERDRLWKESEEDWVQMVLFSDWSHGYLQMPSLMKEAKAVIEELGEWIAEGFVRYKGEGVESGEVLLGGLAGTASPFTSETEDDGSAITFVPRRLTRRTPRSEGNESGSEGTLLNEVGVVSGKIAITEKELIRRRRLIGSNMIS